jgi:hypothetical protein
MGLGPPGAVGSRVVAGPGVACLKSRHPGCESAALETEWFPGCPPGPRGELAGVARWVTPSRTPRCAGVNAIVHAPASGRLTELPFADITPEGGMGVELDIFGQIGQQVTGPEGTFATVLAELTLSGINLRRARSMAAQVLREPPRILPAQHPRSRQTRDRRLQDPRQ